MLDQKHASHIFAFPLSNPTLFPFRIVVLNEFCNYTCHDPFESLIPALAIPIETKNKFECPPSHEDELKSLIPAIDKLVMVGWRGAEENFVKLLIEGLLTHESIPIMVVSSGPEGAAKLRERFAKYQIYYQDWLFAEGGFTDFVRSKRMEDFIG